MHARTLALASLLVLAAAPYPQPPAQASCAAPRLQLEGAAGTERADRAEGGSRPTLRRGEQVTVSGRGFVAGCDDEPDAPTLDCSGGDEGGAGVPESDIALVLLRGRATMRQTVVAEADARGAEDGELGHVTWTFTVPARHPLGRAVLKTEGSEPLPVRLVPAP